MGRAAMTRKAKSNMDHVSLLNLPSSVGRAVRNVHTAGCSAQAGYSSSAGASQSRLADSRREVLTHEGLNRLLERSLELRIFRRAMIRALFGQSAGITAILDCKGDWAPIETPLSTKDYTLKPKLPSDGPRGALRGWTQRPGANQRTRCG